MPELLLQYMWMRRSYAGYEQRTTDGMPIEVINPGRWNTDAGPDFFGATVRIGDMLWSGNIEMHIRASEWYKHKHHTDHAYDNVILHVVCIADKQVYNSRMDAIPQCELRFDETEQQLSSFLSYRQQVCNAAIANNPMIVSKEWKEQLLDERLRQKAEAIDELLLVTQNSWEDAFYITLAHNFGFHTNGLPFELLAKHTPLAYLRKHRQSLFQLTAILLGQAGLIKEDEEILRREYEFMRKKFSFVPIDSAMWKRLRMRPQNFPEMRIRQFAAVIYKNESLFSRLVFAESIEEIRRLLDLGEIEGVQNMGKSSVDLLIINTVVPYMYAYGKKRQDERMIERSYALLRQLPAEKNHIIDDWKALSLTINNAALSQAYLQLTLRYCNDNRCLNCDIGLNIFTSTEDIVHYYE